MVALPPAASMPRFSASATGTIKKDKKMNEGGREREGGGNESETRTLVNVTPEGVGEDCDIGTSHGW